MRIKSSSLSKAILILLGCLALCIVVYWVEFSLLLKELDTSRWSSVLIEKLTWQSDTRQTITQQLINVSTLFILLAFATSCGLPRQIAALVAGINLGALWGAILATLAVTLGCFITFSAARFIFSQKINQKYPIAITKLSDFISEKTFIKAVIIRILPLGSNFLTNILAGVTKVSPKLFVGGSFVGFIPQMIIFSLAGSGIRLGAQNELIASGVLFLIALLLSAYLIKNRKSAQ
jgi:uncharacterized membrane protein YdjX (TVP38/TMEM64 family)